MRVIGGLAKGTKLFPAKGKARPTSELVREAIFNVFSSFEGKIFLDIFAGTGSVGIEALSRGAKVSYFIEQDKILVRVLKENLKRCGFMEKSRIYPISASDALRIIKKDGGAFDAIFADPPYDRGWVERILFLVSAGNLLSSAGVLIIQHSKREKVKEIAGNLVLSKEKSYGDTHLAFYNKDSHGA